MKNTSSPYILVGTLFTAGGYGATFLISEWFRAHGGSDIDAGNTLSMALAGTLAGVPLVGWFAGKVDAARLAAFAALVLACGYLILSSLDAPDPIIYPLLATLLIGFGWGMFYLSAPLALSERLTDDERGAAFTRFSAFQMSGICGGPVLLSLALNRIELQTESAFLWVAATVLVASTLLGMFTCLEPGYPEENSLRPWMRKITLLVRRSVFRPIIMVGLGGAVFSGMMVFQSSLTAGTETTASIFFAIHAVTAVMARLILAKKLFRWPRLPMIRVLLCCLITGVLCLLGIPVNPLFQIAAAILTGAGYGLLYPIIQSWAVNDSPPEDRHAALTWFVVAYFTGIFGFPTLGGRLLGHGGPELFVCSLVILATLELVTAVACTKRKNKAVGHHR